MAILKGCVYVEEFEREQARKRMEADERKRREEEEGAFEVRKIIDVKGSVRHFVY